MTWEEEEHRGKNIVAGTLDIASRLDKESQLLSVPAWISIGILPPTIGGSYLLALNRNDG